jgi:Putative quorum-sensing-regulated virulence factor
MKLNKKHKDATPFDVLLDPPITDDYIIPYGKYKGWQIGKVPKDYLIYIFEKGLNDNAICSYILRQAPKPLEGNKIINKMAIIAESTGSGKDFQPVEAGTYPARCYSMIYMGTLNEEFNGEKKEQKKVRLTFELPTEMKVFAEDKGEQPQVIGKDFTLSMHEKSGLRKFLGSWRGKSFTDDEAKSFDITKLLGIPCSLGISHKVSKTGKTYAEITSVSTLMKGMPIADQINPSFEFSVLEFDKEKFDALPKFIREKVETSNEYLAMVGTPKPEPINAATLAPQDEDMIF